ncbi:MAG: ABC transporter substrate-binding protein [Deltaproteobacteria bacterium]|nr:ABC transporter substrate-binding protein [Deltaproteobacteria bacterium]
MSATAQVTYRTRGIVAVAAGLLLPMGGSCSVVLDFPQCVDHVDCTNVEGFELECRNNVCVEPIPPGTISCGSDADCFGFFDDTVICAPDNTCAALTTDRCELRIRPSDVASDDVVYIGSILPRTGTYTTVGAPLENAIELAVEDFNSTVALPNGGRVGWVACDSQGNPALAAEAARELMEAGVTAVVGPALSSEVIDVANVTAPAGALLLTPTASAEILAQLADDGLVWRVNGNDASQAAAIADRIAQMDPVPERVVALVKNDLYGQGLLESLAPRLANTLPGDGLGTLLYSDLDSFATTEALLSEYGARVAAIFDSNPEVIVVLGSVEARELILFYLEAWAGANPRPTLPHFIVSSEAVPMLEGIVQGVSESFRPTLMNRLEGVDHDTLDPSNYDAFEIRYDIRFSEVEAGLSAGLAYDATMAVLLAMGGSEGTSGSQVAEGLGRLADKSGTPVSFGEGLSFVATTQQVLLSGANVDLRGVSGEIDFDLVTGDVRRNLSGFDVEGSSGGSPRIVVRRRYELNEAPSVTGTWSDL